MLAPQRQAAILERVRRDGGVRVSELARELGASDMTIRRDLEVLAERGLLAKVHGGAVATTVDEPEYTTKSTRQRTEKEAIASAAVRLVAPGSAVALSAGTTTAALAHKLVDVPGITVVTNSLPAAEVLHHSGRTDQTVVLTGGLRTPSDALVGPYADVVIRMTNVDVLFLGVHGMATRAGFTTPNILEAETNRTMLASARRMVVLADHTKWETVGIATIADLDDADILVTDAALPAPARSILAEHVGELIITEE